MCEKGWTGLTFPKEYCGQGLSNTYQVIFNEEMQSLGAAISVISVSNNLWLGSIIAKYGTERQKKEYLTEIAKGAGDCPRDGDGSHQCGRKGIQGDKRRTEVGTR